MVRAIWIYHTAPESQGGNGWCDIGYNAIVDRFGQVFEGAAGGIDRNVIGAHAGGFNNYTFGVSTLGRFDVAQPPAALTEAVAQTIAWKFELEGVDPLGTTQLVSGGQGTAKYTAGTVVTLPVIMGHRDVGATECPGGYLYDQVGAIRSRVAALLGDVGKRLLRTVENGTVYVVSGSSKYTIADLATLASLAPLGPVGYVSQTYLDRRTTVSMMSRVVLAPDGVVYFIDAGMKLPFMSCTMVADYGASCANLVRLDQSLIDAFYTGPPITPIYRTTSGKAFYVSGATKREVTDDLALTQAGLPTTSVHLLETGLGYLPYGAPVIRNGIVLKNRDTKTVSVVAGGAVTTLPDAVQAKALPSVPVEELDDASMRFLTATSVTGVLVKDAGGPQAYLLTEQGKKLVADAAMLPATVPQMSTATLALFPRRRNAGCRDVPQGLGQQLGVQPPRRPAARDRCLGRPGGAQRRQRVAAVPDHRPEAGRPDPGRGAAARTRRAGRVPAQCDGLLRQRAGRAAAGGLVRGHQRARRHPAGARRRHRHRRLQRATGRREHVGGLRRDPVPGPGREVVPDDRPDPRPVPDAALPLDRRDDLRGADQGRRPHPVPAGRQRDDLLRRERREAPDRLLRRLPLAGRHVGEHDPDVGLLAVADPERRRHHRGVAGGRVRPADQAAPTGQAGPAPDAAAAAATPNGPDAGTDGRDQPVRPTQRRGRGRVRAVQVVVLALLAGALIGVGDRPNASAAIAADFDAGNIISDSAFFDPATMTDNQMQAFLDVEGQRLRGGRAPCLKNYRMPRCAKAADGICQGYAGGIMQSAAQIIGGVSRSCGISPQVLLVLLEKEQAAGHRAPARRPAQYTRGRRLRLPRRRAVQPGLRRAS